MALLAGKTEVGVEEFGRDIIVADDPKARLMYYVDSLCSVLDLTSLRNIAKLRKFRQYNTLTSDEQVELYVICDALSPSLLNNKAIFQDDDMCGYDDNKFFKLNVVRHDLLVSEAIIIGGKRCAVKKIMAYKKQWLDWCYTVPMQEMRQGLIRQRQQQQRARQQQQQQQQRSDGSNCVVM